MPSQERAFLPQRAVLWLSGNTFDQFGQPVVAPPVEIAVRWNDKQGEALDATGNTITLDATAVVDRRITIGSRLWLGTLAQWNGTGPGSGQEIPNRLIEVKTYSETPDIKGRNSFKTVGLLRFRDTQ